MESAIDKRMKAETKFDFKDGANNLRLMSSVKDAIKKNPKNLPNWLYYAKLVG